MLRMFSKNDKNFLQEVDQQVQQSEGFWPGKMWRSRFLRKYNIKLKTITTTFYSQRAYKAQFVPSLELTYTLRKIFHVKGGVGKILNADESMVYRFDASSKSWTV